MASVRFRPNPSAGVPGWDAAAAAPLEAGTVTLPAEQDSCTIYFYMHCGEDAATRAGRPPARCTAEFRNVSLKPGRKTDVMAMVWARPQDVAARQVDLRTPTGIAEQRDRLLGEADQLLRDGLIALAERFPQVRKSGRWDDLTRPSAAGSVGILFMHTDRGLGNDTRDPVPDEESFSFMAVIKTPPEQAEQWSLLPMYPRLGLVGQCHASAGDPALEAELKRLLEEGLRPLEKLNEEVPEGGVPAAVEEQRRPAATLRAEATAELWDLLTKAHTTSRALTVQQAGRAGELLGNGADVNSLGPNGATPLHWAAEIGAAEVCRMLLEGGADVDARDEHGATPLHYAGHLSGEKDASNRRVEAARVLLEYGADLWAWDEQGHRPVGGSPGTPYDAAQDGIVKAFLLEQMRPMIRRQEQAVRAAAARFADALAEGDGDRLLSLATEWRPDEGRPWTAKELAGESNLQRERYGDDLDKLRQVTDVLVEPDCRFAVVRLAAPPTQPDRPTTLLLVNDTLNWRVYMFVDRAEHTQWLQRWLNYAMWENWRWQRELQQQAFAKTAGRAPQGEAAARAVRGEQETAAGASPGQAGGRTFNSDVPFYVVAVVEGKTQRVGETPSEQPLTIPPCDRWYVAPKRPFDMQAVRREIEVQGIPGLKIAGATDADFEHLQGLTTLRYLELSGGELTDAGAAYLGNLTGLRGLSLPSTQITDAGLVHLRDLAALRELNLAHTRCTDAGLAQLTHLGILQSLDLQASPVGDAGLIHLAGLAELTVLKLSYTQVTDAGLVHLAGLTGLRELRVRDTDVGDAGLAHLKALTALKRLDLYGTRVGDAGLEYLQHMTALDELDLSRTASVSDAGLPFLAGLTALRKLGLDYTQVTDAGLAELGKLKTLRILQIGHTKVTDAGLVNLKGLTALERLDLWETAVTGVGLADLAGLPALHELQLWGSEVTDAGLQPLEAMKGLKKLPLFKTRITDAGLVHLKGLTGLRELSLWETGITDAGLANLEGMTNLEQLNLMYLKIGDAGVAHLANCKGLVWLQLRGTQVTDAGLEYLKGLTSLRSVCVMSTRVTEEGVEQLRKALPKAGVLAF
jgi:internalin A